MTVVTSLRDPTFPATLAAATRASNRTVYGVILNDADTLARMGPALHEKPHLAPPRAPVLYIKPANTLVADGATVRLPSGADAVEVGATVGVVFARDCGRMAPQDALSCIAGYALVADLSLPHASYYRPAIREKCFDGACPMADPLIPTNTLPDPASLLVHTDIDGRTVASRGLAELIRPIPQLVADVAGFITLRRGDVLLTGVPWQAPQACGGQTVRIRLTAGDEALSILNFSLLLAGDRP